MLFVEAPKVFSVDLEKELELLWKCINAVHEGQVWASNEQLHLLLNALRSEAVIPPFLRRE